MTDTRANAGRIPSPLRAARRAVQALFLLNGALFATWASRVPAAQAAHGLSNGALGLCLFAIAGGAVIAMPLAGLLTARIGSDQVCRISALIYAAMLPAILLAPGLAGFVTALFCFGASHAALDVAMNAQAVAIEKRHGEPIMSSFHALWSIGGLLGAAAGGVLAAQGVKPITHFVLMALALGATLPLVFPRLLQVPEEQFADPANRIAVPVFSLPSRGLLCLGLVALCVMLGEGAMADWSAVYLRNNIRTTESVAAAGYATFSVAMAIGRLSGDRLTTRFRPVNLVRAGGILAAAGLLLAIVFGHAAFSLAGFALVGLGFATVVPIVFTAAGNTRGMTPGVALASVSSLGYLGFLLGPPIIGFASEGLGLRGALGIVVMTSLLATLLAPAVTSRQTQQAQMVKSPAINPKPNNVRLLTSSPTGGEVK
jgi:predicted MFS family arabinose efflux permease